ncbi:hypothetical protein HY643_04030 [Candidatus Woesearchaeota archaeon]|nr:hypothetical protein [Candidatus Woesearchaeota archaeon]
MKKGCIILIFVLLLVPLVSSKIVLNGPVQENFNLGDKMLVSGFVYRDESTNGFLQLSVVCDNKATNLLKVPISIAAKEQKVFPQDIAVPPITASNSMLGVCIVKAQLLNPEFAIIEEENSKSFIVAKALKGNFILENTKIQKGRTLKMTGTINTLNNAPVSGSAEIYFKTDKSNYLIDVIQVADGSLSYSYQTTSSPPGSYSINILVRDIYGNEGFFGDTASFLLTDKLFVLAEIDKQLIVPGESINIIGNVKNVLNEQVEEGLATIYLGEDAYTTKIEDGRFEYSIPSQKNIKSGTQTIRAIVKDEFGNSGEDSVNLEVKAVATSLETQINSNLVNPEDVIEITPILIDQGGEVMQQDVLMTVIDSDDYEIYSSKIPSNEKVYFKIPKFGAPGEWTIKIEIGKLSDEKKFEVNEKEAVAVGLEGQVITITNLGNVKYKDDVEVIVAGEKEYKLFKKRAINVNDTIAIDLNEEVPSGEYDIFVPLKDGKKVFNDVTVVSGKARRSFTFIYNALAILSIAVLTLIGYSEKKRFGKRGFKREPESIEEFVIPKKEEPEEEIKPRAYNFGRASREDVEYFKKRVVDDMRKSEEAEKRKHARFSWMEDHSDSVKEEKKDGKKGGLFSMFN